MEATDPSAEKDRYLLRDGVRHFVSCRAKGLRVATDMFHSAAIAAAIKAAKVSSLTPFSDYSCRSI